MRIGFFSDSYRPYVSGVVRSIETFAGELSALGHEVYIFAPGYPRYRRREEKVFRFFSLPAPGGNDFALAVPFSWRLGATVARLGLDLIHVHSPFLMGHLGARCARRSRLPLVFTYHTLYHQYAHYLPLVRGLSEAMALRWSLTFAGRCDRVIAPTESVRDFLVAEGLAAPIEVIPTGVTLEYFQAGDPAWLRQRHAPGPGPVLLYAGRIAREKNLFFLLEAFRQVLRTVPAARLVLVGDGPDLTGIRRRISALALSDRVFLTGRLPLEGLRHCYAGADLFLFPSVTETQGIVLLEAMAAGLPVVAVRATGSADTVADGVEGLLVPESTEAFAAAVVALLADSVRRRRMSGAARAKAEQCSARAMAQRLATVYLDLTAGRRPARQVLAGSRRKG